MTEELGAYVVSIRYDNIFLNDLFVDIVLRKCGELQINEIEINRRSDGELNIKLPYITNPTLTEEKPCITLRSNKYIIEIKDAIETFLSENPEFEAILNRTPT